MSTSGPSGSHPKVISARPSTSTSTTSVTETDRKFIRRRRSRSSDSRRSRKENTKHLVVSGKKRKTADERPPSPGLSLEASTVKVQHLHNSKGSRGRSEQKQKVGGKIEMEPSRQSFPDSIAVLSSDEELRTRKYQPKARLPPRSHLAPPPLPVTSGAASTHTKDMREQIIELKKETESAKQHVSRQNLYIDSLKKDLADAKRANRKNETQIGKLRGSAKKSEELLGNIQTSLQCQICLELLLKPYALSPCGHVLCQTCLQEWFRSAPAQEHEQEEDGPIPTLFRKKTCPCCRTHIYSRPIQLFLIKSIATLFAPALPAMSLAIETPGSTADADGSADVDPWAGIFPEEIDVSDEEYPEDGAEDGGDVWSNDMGFSGSEGDSESGGHWYGSDSDAEPYVGHYVHPAWERPLLDIDCADVADAPNSEYHLMRRGATLNMIQRYDMRWDPTHGLVATTDAGNQVYLGWNIEVDAEDDEGEEFMSWVEYDIFERPERWDYHELENGLWAAWKLVREDEAGEDDEDGDDDTYW